MAEAARLGAGFSRIEHRAALTRSLMGASV
jgi:hypothetical protein